MSIFRRIATEANDYNDENSEEIYILDKDGNLVLMEDTTNERIEERE